LWELPNLSYIFIYPNPDIETRIRVQSIGAYSDDKNTELPYWRCGIFRFTRRTKVLNYKRVF